MNKLGAKLPATLQPNGAGSEATQFHHPDRLGTRLITNAADSNYFEQVSLPYGTALDAESTGATNRRFTSYDRSASSGLDYAVNRHYDPQQGRFTQADPAGMKATNLHDPQSLNMYAYCGGDPINRTDPKGLSWLSKLFKGVGKVFSAVGKAIATVLNNRWVQIGVFIASFIIPFVGPALAKALNLAVKIYNTIADIGAQLQLYGQLFQGKFKELGISVGLGIIGSYVGMVEDAVVAGIQLGIKLDGLSLSSVLDGAAFGFKGGLGNLTRNLGFGALGRSLKDMFIPASGLFGGPGNPTDDDLVFDDTVSGVDDVDTNAFKPHDRATRSPLKKLLAAIDPRQARIFQRNADARLVGNLLRNAPRVRLFDIALGGRPSAGSVYKFFALNYFGGATVVRSADLVIRR